MKLILTVPLYEQKHATHLCLPIGFKGAQTAVFLSSCQ